MKSKLTRFLDGLRYGLIAVVFLWALVARVAHGQDAEPSQKAEPEQTVKVEEPGPAQAPDEAEAQPGEAPGEDYFKIFKDGFLGPKETVPNFAVVFGDALVDGKVRRDLVVVGGDLSLNGSVGGDVIVVLGSARMGPRASVKGDTAVVLGELQKSPTTKLGHRPIEVALGKWLHFLSPIWDWCKCGLLLGRPLPPSLGWAWTVAAVHLLVYLAIAVLLPRPVQGCHAVLESKALLAFFVGILGLIGLFLLLLILISSVIGLIIVPFLGCGALAAVLVGKAAVFQFIGLQVFRRFNPATNVQTLLALIVGAALITLAYTVPVLGLIVWLVLLPLGLGAAMMAAVAAFRQNGRRDNPPPPPGSGETPPPLRVESPGSPTVAHLAPPIIASSTPFTAAECASLPRVGFWLRLLATLLDLLIFLPLAWLVPFPLFWFAKGPSLFLLAWMVYHVVLWSWKGTTVGGIICRLKVIRTNGQPLDPAVAAIRVLGAVISFVAMGLGFFWAGWSHEKQAWHDKIAGTVIVRLPRGVPLV